MPYGYSAEKWQGLNRQQQAAVVDDWERPARREPPQDFSPAQDPKLPRRHRQQPRDRRGRWTRDTLDLAASVQQPRTYPAHHRPVQDLPGASTRPDPLTRALTLRLVRPRQDGDSTLARTATAAARSAPPPIPPTPAARPAPAPTTTAARTAPGPAPTTGGLERLPFFVPLPEPKEIDPDPEPVRPRRRGPGGARRPGGRPPQINVVMRQA